MSSVISISGVSKTYATGVPALKAVDLDIRRGEIFALLGPNGAGKTTLISIVCGIVNRSTGTVTVAAGVVTLSGGTFPSWLNGNATDGELTVSGTNYTVASYQSSSQITLDDTSLTVASASAYSVQRVKYAAPDDFGGLDGVFTYPSSTSGASDVTNVNEAQIRSIRQSGAA